MKVTFNINFHTVWGQKLCVVGSIPELGSWEPALAKEMNYSGDGNWKLELDLPPDIKDIEYRYFLSVNDKQIFEEWEKNHRIVLDGQSDSYILYDYWQIRPDNLAFYSSAFTWASWLIRILTAAFIVYDQACGPKYWSKIPVSSIPFSCIPIS